jgi:hypothetical protein
MTQTRNSHLAPLAVLAAALAAAGSAYAASRLHGSSSSPLPGIAGPLSATPVSSNSGAHGPGGDHRGGGGDELAAAATYLGIPQADLLTSLRSGKTLAQVADATSGKTVAGLIAALVAAEKTELAAAVTAGTITQAQSDQIASTLTARFTALVNRTRPAHDDHGQGLRPGYAPRGTPPANGTHI